MFEIFLQKLGMGILTVALSVSSFLGANTDIVTQDDLEVVRSEIESRSLTLGAAPQFVGGKPYFLYGSGISSTDTSITLTEFTQPVSGTELTMSDFGTIGYATIDPTNSTKKEFISFTGISQDSSSARATLTGVIRGLQFVSPYTTSSSLKQSHGGGSRLVISNSPQFYQQFIDYTNGLSFGGIGGASNTATGTVEMATGAEAAASTLNGTAGRLALGADLATSTYNSTTAGNVIPVTDLSTKVIDSDFLGISTSTIYGDLSVLGMIGKNMEVKTSSGTFTIPSGVTRLHIKVQAGGGGGWGTASGDAGSTGAGGGSGGYCESIINVSGTSTIGFLIGSAGTAGTNGGAGTAGGNSDFSSFCKTTGGGAAGDTSTGGGTAGTASGGDINIAGQKGGNGHDTGTIGISGAGASSVLGIGGMSLVGGGTALTGNAGVGYGSGGGAGIGSAAALSTGGVGRQGIVIIRW